MGVHYGSQARSRVRDGREPGRIRATLGSALMTGGGRGQMTRLSAPVSAESDESQATLRRESPRGIAVGYLKPATLGNWHL